MCGDPHSCAPVTLFRGPCAKRLLSCFNCVHTPGEDTLRSTTCLPCCYLPMPSMHPSISPCNPALQRLSSSPSEFPWCPYQNHPILNKILHVMRATQEVCISSHRGVGACQGCCPTLQGGQACTIRIAQRAGLPIAVCLLVPCQGCQAGRRGRGLHGILQRMGCRCQHPASTGSAGQLLGRV